MRAMSRPTSKQMRSLEVLRVKYVTAPYALARNYQLIPCFVLHELVALPIIRPSSPTGTVISHNPGVPSALT